MSKRNKKKHGKKQCSSPKPKTTSELHAQTPKSERQGETVTTLAFTAIDTLFFRESRPMEAQGQLSSVFPAPSRTLIGAVRRLMGDQLQVDWSQFKRDHSAVEVIGYGDDLGKLQFQGTWLAYKNERLYPAPLHLMREKEDEKVKLFQLQLEKEGVWCDLGDNVRLAKLPSGKEGSKPLENTWITYATLHSMLQGKLPEHSDLKKASDLFDRESRLGIARDNATRMVREGLLYQTEHIRPKVGLSMELDIIAGLSRDDLIPNNTMIRLGGEGRSAGLTVEKRSVALPDVSNNVPPKRVQGLLLYLLTPLLIDIENAQQPLPSFEKEEQTDVTVWRGQLHGIDLLLQGAVTGKVLREGGWDMAEHRPRTVQSFIPAGSVFFCTLPESKNTNKEIGKVIKALNNTQIGKSTEYGYGHIAAGWWI